jgi:hypothetical protein
VPIPVRSVTSLTPGDATVGHDLVDHPVDGGHRRVRGGQPGEQEGLGDGDQLRLAGGGQELGDQPVTVRPEDLGDGDPAVGQGADGGGEERVEAGRPEPDPEGAALARQRAGEAPGEHAHDPGAARLGDQVDRRVGKGVLGVGVAAPEVPGDRPEVLDHLGKGQARPGAGDVELPAPGAQAEHPPRRRLDCSHAVGPRALATAGAVAFVQAYPASGGRHWRRR